MELLWERMLAFYLELMMLIVPDEKRGVRQRRLAKGFAVCTALLCIGLVLGGAFLLAALDSAWGLLPLGIGAAETENTLDIPVDYDHKDDNDESDEKEGEDNGDHT